MRSLVLALLLVTFIPAWAQEATPPATAVSPAAAVKTEPAPPVTEKATIFVYRYKQFAGSGLEPSIYCDENQLARMDNGRYFVVQVPAGRHTFRANDKQSGIEAEFKAGQKYYIRIEIATGLFKGHGRLVLVMPEQGEFETKKLKPLDAEKIKNTDLVIQSGN